MNSYTSTDKNFAVKALIYRTDGKILLQKRNKNKNILWPGCWNLFGGMVKKNEGLENAITRELIEELGVLPGKISEKIFDWKDCFSDIINVCFSIKINRDFKSLKLFEGEKMSWYNPSHLVKLRKTSFLDNNTHNIIDFMGKFNSKLKLDFENQVVEKHNLIKKNNRVYYTKNNPVIFKDDTISDLNNLALINKVPLLRLCLHKDDNEKIHEMLMVHSKPQKIGPLKQKRNASLSYYVIKGLGVIFLYNDEGKKIKTIPMDSNNINGNQYCRLEANKFRSIESISNRFVFLEICSGPFEDKDTIWMTKQNNSLIENQ